MAAAAAGVYVMSDNFYRAFQEGHRGPRELIKARLRVYLPFIEPLSTIYGTAEAIDLGCGRGEWLEVLQEVGFSAQGVDLDDGMLAACREIGLNVQTDEAVKFLKEQPEASQVVVSGFHIVEHIPFPDLQALVQEALRILKPGGLLILETPNPENLVVGTASFYLDPTHHHPIPPGLLSFLPEHYGYERVKILRLQESSELFDNNKLTLVNVLAGVSPDYAVVAQKAGGKEIMAATEAAFATEFGLTLDYLAGKYDQQVKALTQQAIDRAAQAETIAQQAIDRAAQAETIAQQAIDRTAQAETIAQQAIDRAAQAETIAQQAIDRTAQAETIAQQAIDRTAQAETIAQQAIDKAVQAENRASQAESMAQGMATQLSAVYSSTSWVLTKPLRGCKRMAGGDFSIFGRVTARCVLKTKQALRPIVSSSISYVLRSPTVHLRLYSLVQHFPRLHQRLRRIAINTGILDNDRHAFSPLSTSNSNMGRSGNSLTLRSPLARRVYMDLKAAIDNEKSGEN